MGPKELSVERFSFFLNISGEQDAFIAIDVRHDNDLVKFYYACPLLES